MVFLHLASFRKPKTGKTTVSKGYLEIRAPFNRRKVASAEDLWSFFMEYREHSIATPIVEPKLFNSKEGPIGADLDKIRPLTLNGLCNFIGIHPGTWDSWKKREITNLDVERKDDPEAENFFLEVLLQIESIIYDDQFQGAAVDIFNAGIISRKLGLADKREINNPDGNLSPYREMTPEEIAKEMERRGLQLPDLD